jgi:hypothetical protein
MGYPFGDGLSPAQEAELATEARRLFATSYCNTRAIWQTSKDLRARLRTVALSRAIAFDMYNDRLREQPIMSEGRPAFIACSKGCSTCCHMHVDISSTDAAAIALYLEEFRPAELAGTRTMLAQQLPRIAGLSPDARWAAGIPCPFLRDHCCAIYTMRPQACRGYCSVDLPACLKAWENRATGRRGTLLLHSGSRTASLMTWGGSDFALREQGLQYAIGELSAMVATIMAPGMLDAWLAGRRVYKPGGRTARENLKELEGMYEDAKSLGDIDDWESRNNSGIFL